MTVATRIMLPAHVILFALAGGNYVLTPKSRLLYSSGLAYAEHLMNLRAWGAIFTVTAVVMVAALAVHHRTLYRFGLWLGIVTMSVWAAVLILAAINRLASPTGWCWPTFVAVACFATNQSLLTREVR